MRKELVQLGRALAFDPILSGNRNMACMTCHLPAFATGDGKNLSIGEGGIGLGTNRTLGRGVFIPRNAPPLFNLAGLNQLFWDGRVSVDAAGAFHTPANTQVTPAMTQVFEFGAVSAIGLFPVTSRTEMRGQDNIAITTGGFTRNELAQIPDSNFTGIWSAVMARLGAIPEYRQLFEAAYPGTPFSSMTFAHASNAMAGFFVGQLHVLQHTVGSLPRRQRHGPHAAAIQRRQRVHGHDGQVRRLSQRGALHRRQNAERCARAVRPR